MRYLLISSADGTPSALVRKDGWRAEAYRARTDEWQPSAAATDLFSGVNPAGVEVDEAGATAVAEELRSHL